MRKVLATVQMSLDGVMQAPGGPEEDGPTLMTQGSSQLLQARTSPKGVTITTYERAGDVKTGTFGQDKSA